MNSSKKKIDREIEKKNDRYYLNGDNDDDVKQIVVSDLI